MFDLLKGLKLDDPLLRPRKVAEMLGIAEQTLAVWRCRQNHGNAAPDLAWVKIGRRSIRYRLSDVQRFINMNLRVDDEQAPVDSEQGSQQS